VLWALQASLQAPLCLGIGTLWARTRVSLLRLQSPGPYIHLYVCARPRGAEP